jgi:hypothetical protein
MDPIITICLALTPVPCLSRAHSILRSIWNAIQRVQSSKQQLKALAISVALLLRTLDNEIRSGHLVESQITPEADALQTSVAT